MPTSMPLDHISTKKSPPPASGHKILNFKLPLRKSFKNTGLIFEELCRAKMLNLIRNMLVTEPQPLLLTKLTTAAQKI